MSNTNEGWQICPTCPPDDNEWPASSFRACGTAFKSRICDDCWNRRYVRLHRRCVNCNQFGSTWRRRENADKPFAHKVCPPPPERKPRALASRVCVVCGGRMAAGGAANVRGWYVHAPCVKSLPADLIPSLHRSERRHLL